MMTSQVLSSLSTEGRIDMPSVAGAAILERLKSPKIPRRSIMDIWLGCSPVKTSMQGPTTDTTESVDVGPDYLHAFPQGLVHLGYLSSGYGHMEIQSTNHRPPLAILASPQPLRLSSI